MTQDSVRVTQDSVRNTQDSVRKRSGIAPAIPEEDSLVQALQSFVVVYLSILVDI